ncbi:MAG: phage portal protein [Synergistaceae bacterium]|nr:phage portal protein [Synergistaceae bacterium]
MPWLERFEQGIIKDILLEDEKDVYFPKFNVDGLLRGDYESRMRGYATGFANGFLSPNNIRQLENLDPIPDEEGGNVYVANGSYVKLKNIGVAYLKNQAVPEEPEKPKEPEEEEETEIDEKSTESKGHAERKKQRKVERRS